MLKKQIIEQNKCRLDISRFYTLTKGGRGVSVVQHAKLKYGGQTAVPYGCPYLLPWGRRFMVKQQKHEKH